MTYKTSRIFSLVFLIIALCIPLIYSAAYLSMALLVFMPVVIALLVISAVFAILSFRAKRTKGAIALLSLSVLLILVLLFTLLILCGCIEDIGY